MINYILKLKKYAIISAGVIVALVPLSMLTGADTFAIVGFVGVLFFGSPWFLLNAAAILFLWARVLTLEERVRLLKYEKRTD